VITEVALELAEDRRGRERGEGHAAGGVEALDRLQETDDRHLDEVVEGFAPSGEALREQHGEGPMMFDEPVPSRPFARAAVRREELVALETRSH
jgi:hypothetical protein